MTEQEIWKTWQAETYCFWSMVPFDVKPKLGDVAAEGASCDYQGYHYEVKKVAGKDGKKDWYKVVKSPAGNIPPPNKPYDPDGAKKGHMENIEMHKEHITIMREHITATNNLNETLIALITRWDAIIADELRKQENHSK